MKKYLVIDIGGTAIKYALMYEDGSFIEQEKGDIPTPMEGLDALVGAIDSFASKYMDQVSGIAISAPGRIDNKTGYFYTAGALSEYLCGVNLGDILKEKYGVPVAIDNDGKCAANAELWLGALKDVDSGVIIGLGTGIAGGIILNRKLWRGIHGTSSEFSALPTNYKDLSYQNFWANVNGVYGLLVPYAMRKGIDVKETNGRKFFDALHGGDEDAKVVFNEFISTLLVGIVGLQASLDVEKYCIGGGISAQDTLIHAIQEASHQFFKNAGPLPIIEPIIDRCTFNNDANLIGALKNYLDLYN